MQTIYLLKYNNYYDRLVKKEESLDDYLLADADSISIENYDFVPGDGVSKQDIFDYDPTTGKNYVLVCNGTDIESRWFITETVRTRDGRYLVSLQRDAIVDSYNSLVKSPIFIEKATLTENDPFIFNTEDVQVNQIKTNEVLIRDQSRVPWLVAYILRKTAVTETYEETMEFQGQTETKKYMRFYGADPIKVNIPRKTYINSDYTTYDNPMSPLWDASQPDKIRYSAYEGNPCFNFDDITYVVRYSISGEDYFDVIGISADGYFSIHKYVLSSSLFTPGFRLLGQASGSLVIDSSLMLDYLTNNLNTGLLMQYQLNTADKLYGLSTLEKILPTDASYSGKTNRDLVADEYYYMNPVSESKTKSVTEYSSLIHGEISNPNTAATVFDTYFQQQIYTPLGMNRPLLIDAIASIPGKARCGDKKCDITTDIKYCSYKHIPTTTSQILFIDTNTIGTQLNHTRCEDACYDIIYVPYFDGSMAITDAATSRTVYIPMTKQLAMEIMQRIKTCCGANCVDVQIVPFCPDKPINKWSVVDDGSGGEKVLAATFDSIENLIPMYDENSSDTFEKYTENYLSGITNATGMVFWSKACSNSFSASEIYNDIDAEGPSSQTVEELFDDTDSKKTSSQCNFCRLVSPNYNGQFEFKPSKIGKVFKLDIDYMYMPYTPYIKVSPNFGGLYGNHSFNGKNDAIGLVCNGSFSIPQYDDKWADYCIQNKNYQNIFDREVKNMEVNNSLTNVNNIVNAITGVGAGAIGGSMARNPNPGTIATGAIAGAIKGGTRIVTDILGQREALDYKKDMYAMSLQNIQALPYSLSNVGVFNNNNKIFPFIEFYTCTVEEKTAFENKIKYNGMTVGRIGRLLDYIGIVPNYTYIEQNEYNYIKGKLIRLDYTDEDNHFINYLASEMDKGAFFRRNG